MNTKKGIVKEVYIPTLPNQDVMYSNKIGFKIQTENEFIDIVEEQNEENSKILKNDKVTIIEQIIDGKKYININRFEDEDYE